MATFSRRPGGREPSHVDVREELRAIGQERKAARASGSQAPHKPGEGTEDIAARLAVMFPGLPRDTVHAVLSELFRADARCSRAQLADKAVAALLEMGLADASSPQALTSFEAVSLGDLAPSAPPLGDLAPSAPTLQVGAQADAASEEHRQPWEEELLDAHLAAVLALPDGDMQSCVKTLSGVLKRIADAPADARVRRLRRANARFQSEVGKHEAAVDLLRLAGFEDCVDSEDPALVFRGEPGELSLFHLTHEALRGIVKDLGIDDAGKSSPSSSRGFGAPPQRSRSQTDRQKRIADLTERRLQDPRGFRDSVRAKGSTMRGQGGIIAKTRPPDVAQPGRRAQHFTLSDVECMRITDEIASTPSYADEYRRNHQAGAAHSYTEIVARGYDPQLISRQAVDGTNRYRATKGLAPVRWHQGIAQIAAEHARQMASGEMPFSHDGFDARVRAFPVVHRSAAENLALNKGVADVAQCAVDGWIKSPGHEENLRGPFNLCGIGAAQSANGTWYLTQLFASAG